MFCIPKARNSVYLHLFPYNKQISLGSLFLFSFPFTRALSSFYFRFNAIESDIALHVKRHLQEIIFSTILLLRLVSQHLSFLLLRIQTLNIHWFDFACSTLNKVQPKKSELFWYSDLEEAISHNKFVSELYPASSKGPLVRSFVRSVARTFVRSLVPSFVYLAWCLVGSAEQAFAFSRSGARLATGIIFRRIQVRVGRSVPLPGLRTVDYASLPTYLYP